MFRFEKTTDRSFEDRMKAVLSMKAAPSMLCALFALALLANHAHADWDTVRGPLEEFGADDVPALIDALEHADMGVRWNAALVLGKIGDEAAVAPLIERLEQDDNARVRRRAMEALVRLGATDAVPALIKALDDPERFVRRDAARSLGELGAEQAVSALIERLADEEGFVRRDAAWALGEIGDETAISALQERTQESARAYSDEVPLPEGEISPVAREARLALGKIGGEGALEALVYLADNAPAADLGGYSPDMAFYDPFKADVRARAVLIMGELGAEAVPEITRIFGEVNGDDVAWYGWHLRHAAIEALKSIGGSAGVEGLSEALRLVEPPWQRGDARDLRSVALALGELGDPDALPALREMLEIAEDEDNWSRDHRDHQRIARDIRRAISQIED